MDKMLLSLYLQSLKAKNIKEMQNSLKLLVSKEEAAMAEKIVEDEKNEK
ncbi:hypothetical protein FACS1894132_12850 [Clostridia bacterium]|nr:hypothetical protein FACS1894132_12850 [Clostridia bacterium]